MLQFVLDAGSFLFDDDRAVTYGHGELGSDKRKKKKKETLYTPTLK